MTGAGDWLEALRAACARSTQAAVARRLGVSPAMINQVLKSVYRANTDHLAALVRGKLMAEQVECPVVGEVPLLRCQRNRDRPTGPLAQHFDLACPGCPNAVKGER